ncbi:MAG: DUF167 domain-containing protein [Verrucomicrobiota bacterium]|nr:DUF167 domain-containing protein [Verrucomicrobiota bacterium]
MSAMAPPNPIKRTKTGSTLKLIVQPGSSRDTIDRINENGQLKVRIKATLVDFEANKTTIRFIAKTLGIPHRNIKLIHGAKSRNKIVNIDGVNPEAAALKTWNTIII